jgi:hypothetical protein
VALYRYVARKVSRAKWQPPEEWAGKHATADGVTACLKTGSNRLSLWRFADPATDLQEVALAMAATAEKLESMDLAWLPLEGLERFVVSETPGKTPIPDLQARHIDLCSLDGRSLLDFADGLYDRIQAGNCLRFTQKQLIDLVRAALREGRVTPDTLQGRVREQVAS